MRITYMPSVNRISIFNTFTKESLQIEAPEKDENYDLCPAVIVHKANAFLQMNYILDKEKERK